MLALCKDPIPFGRLLTLCPFPSVRLVMCLGVLCMTSALVREREQRVFILMKINGISLKACIAAHILFYSVLLLLPQAVILGVGAVLGIPLFRFNGPFYVAAFLLNSLSLVPLSLLLATMAKNAKRAWIPQLIFLVAPVLIGQRTLSICWRPSSGRMPSPSHPLFPFICI
jgi:hypothetical protein